MHNKLPSACKLFFLQFLQVTANFENCLDKIDEPYKSESVRIIILNDDKYKQEILNFAENIIKYINKSGMRKLHIELKFINDEPSDPSSFSSVGTHLVITWNAQTLHQFLNYNPKVVIPLARHVYKFFLVKFAPKWKTLLSRLWLDFGVLDVCFCNHGKHDAYSLFPINDKRIHSLTETHVTKRARNFNQYPLKVSMFIRNFTSILEMPKLLNFDPSYAHLGRTKPTVHGLDGFILKTIAEYVNFSIDLVGGFGEENFGFGLPNGTITGSLGVIANGEAQISANGRFIMDYDTTAIEFTVPYDTDKMCPVVPKSKMIPNWLNSFHCFTTRTWLALYSTFCICILLWYLVGPTRKHLQVWWEMYAIFRGIPVKIRPTLAQGFFLFWCMAFSVIILTLVQASFFNFFTHPLFYQEIDTLEELDQSNLPIATNFYQFDSDGSELMANLKKKRVRYLSNFMSVVAYNRNLALLERKRDVDSIIKTQYLSADGTPLLHVVNECFTSYFISYIVPRGSALLNIFDVILLRLVESGLTSKWYQDVEYSITTEELMNLNHRKKLWRAFNLFDLQAAFFLWVVGVNYATLTLFCELFFSKKCMFA